MENDLRILLETWINERGTEWFASEQVEDVASILKSFYEKMGSRELLGFEYDVIKKPGSIHECYICEKDGVVFGVLDLAETCCDLSIEGPNKWIPILKLDRAVDHPCTLRDVVHACYKAFPYKQEDIAMEVLNCLWIEYEEALQKENLIGFLEEKLSNLEEWEDSYDSLVSTAGAINALSTALETRDPCSFGL